MSHTETSGIYTLAYEGRFSDVMELLQEHPEYLRLSDQHSRMLIHWASLSGNADLVSYLIQEGQPVDAMEDMGMTPLIMAASAGRLGVVKKLIENGANVDAKTHGGHSALQYAASKGWCDIVEVLVENSADVNIADIFGATPLHRACSKGLTSVVRYLLTCGEHIIIDPRDSSGNTPLHLACEEGRITEAKLLLQHGASIEALNKEKQTPLQLASDEVLNNLREDNLIS